MLPRHDIPAPGFRLISGKRKPPEGTYIVQFRNSWIDQHRAYGPSDVVWVHTGSAWDIVAVKPA